MCLAVPGKIISITGDDPLTRSAKVSFGGTVKEINLAYVPEAKADDYVIVHVGFALNLVDKEEALKIISAINEMESLAPDYLDTN
jgi:hydrogenase expression/formation protein HypC